MFCFKFWENCFDSRKTKLGDINFRQFMTIKVHLRLVFAYILLCPFLPPRNMQGSNQSVPFDAPCLKQPTLVSLHVCHNFCLSRSWYSYFPLSFGIPINNRFPRLLRLWPTHFNFYFLLLLFTFKFFTFFTIFPSSQLLIWYGPWPPYS